MQLVALIESLQFRKIGRVYSKPTSRIQMLQNVTLALQAIADDHIKLVNIGESESDVLQKVALALQSQRQQQLKGALPWERFVAPALQQEVRYAALERLTFTGTRQQKPESSTWLYGVNNHYHNDNKRGVHYSALERRHADTPTKTRIAYSNTHLACE